MLFKLDPLQYFEMTDIASVHDSGSVYPLAVAQQIQDGDIFVDSLTNCKSALFWTYTGFAYITGMSDAVFLNDIYELVLGRTSMNSRRFVLMTQDKTVLDYFAKKDDVIIERRYLFSYESDQMPVDFSLSSGYELREIDDQLLTKISGKIVPSMFWKCADQFLTNGKGYCITYRDEVVSWAFSAAVSSREIDIGIETKEEHKQKGLGLIVANKMIRYSMNQNKSPVWACYYKNIASARMAEKLGFVKAAECCTIKKK